MTKDIFAPVQGEEVQIGQQMNSFSITLSDEFLSTVKMSSVCACVHGHLTPDTH
jgi:cleavage and polyadenylation specificity factor subunit 2